MNYAKLVSIKMVIKSHSVFGSDILVLKFIAVASSKNSAAVNGVESVFIIESTFVGDVVVVVDVEWNISVDTMSIGVKIEERSIVSCRFFHEQTKTDLTLSKVCIS